MKILIDADALVALAKTDDSNHQQAIKISQKLRKAFFYITPFTIPEAATVLAYKVSQKQAVRFLKNARERQLIAVNPEPEIYALADRIFCGQQKKGTSWIDCLNVAVVKKMNLEAIFSFDRFYRKFGIKYPI